MAGLVPDRSTGLVGRLPHRRDWWAILSLLFGFAFVAFVVQAVVHPAAALLSLGAIAGGVLGRNGAWWAAATVGIAIGVLQLALVAGVAIVALLTGNQIVAFGW